MIFGYSSEQLCDVDLIEDSIKDKGHLVDVLQAYYSFIDMNCIQHDVLEIRNRFNDEALKQIECDLLNHIFQIDHL